MALTRSQIDRLFFQMTADGEQLLQQGVAQFDGSAAWASFAISLGDEVRLQAKQCEDAGDVMDVGLPNQFGNE